MAFMKPFYTDESFVTYTNKHGESHSVPSAFADLPKGDAIEVEYTPKGKFWAHLSAPGYMDQTDWDGPFDTLQEARDHIRDTFDVDPDTGDDLQADETVGLNDGSTK